MRAATCVQQLLVFLRRSLQAHGCIFFFWFCRGRRQLYYGGGGGEGGVGELIGAQHTRPLLKCDFAAQQDAMSAVPNIHGVILEAAQ